MCSFQRLASGFNDGTRYFSVQSKFYRSSLSTCRRSKQSRSRYVYVGLVHGLHTGLHQSSPVDIYSWHQSRGRVCTCTNTFPIKSTPLLLDIRFPDSSCVSFCSMSLPVFEIRARSWNDIKYARTEYISHEVSPRTHYEKIKNRIMKE